MLGLERDFLASAWFATERCERMNRAELIQRLLPTFLDEARQYANAMGADLLELSRTDDADRRKELVVELFRTAHSLKGASRSVEQSEIERICQKLEDLLGPLRQRHEAVTPPVLAVLAASAEVIAAAVLKLRLGEPLPLSKMRESEVALARLVASLGPRPPSAA